MGNAVFSNPWANQVGGSTASSPSQTPSSLSKDSAFVYYKQNGKTFTENKPINTVVPGSCQVAFDHPQMTSATRRYVFTLDDDIWFLTPDDGKSKIITISSMKEGDSFSVRFGVTDYYYDYIEFSGSPPKVFVSNPVNFQVSSGGLVIPPSPTPTSKAKKDSSKIPFIHYVQNGIITRKIEVNNSIFPFETLFFFDPPLSVNLSSENITNNSVLTPNYVYTLDDKIWRLTDNGGKTQIIRLSNLKVGDRFSLRFGMVNPLSGASEAYKQYSQFSVNVPSLVSDVINIEVVPAPSPSPTPTQTLPTPTPSASLTPTPSGSPPVTPTPSPLIGSSPTPTPTPTKTPSSTPSTTPSPSVSPSVTPSISVTPSVTPSKQPRPAISQKPKIILPTPTPSRIISGKQESQKNKGQTIFGSISSSFSFYSEKESISPFLDLQKTSFTFVHNIINSLSDSEKILSEEAAKGGFAKARYITKPVKLNSDTPASKFFISFSANVPSETKVRLYYKCFNTVENPEDTLEKKKWVLIGTSEGKNTFTEDEFIDFEFRLDEIEYDGNSSLKEFDMFSIKIVKESTNDSIVPRIKDFRAIALS